MSTDRDVPARWQSLDEVLDLGEAMDAHFHHAMTELGTAESLVRDLARNLKEAREHLWIAQMVMGAETRVLVREICEKYDAALSRIPKELQP